MTFLADILARKRLEVAERRKRLPEAELRSRRVGLTAGRGFADALATRGQPPRVSAEIKRASPSLGAIRADLDPVALARRYAAAGAVALSVLTDGPGFGGSLDDLAAVRAAVALPLLRKDFLLEPYQLFEARLAGADAILLIVAALPASALSELLGLAAELGLSALVEVHDRAELDRALEVGARLIGINNRNLATFEVDLATSEALLPRIPATVGAVTESGVKGRAEVERLRRAGASNFLVGEALVRAADPEALLRELLSVP